MRSTIAGWGGAWVVVALAGGGCLDVSGLGAATDGANSDDRPMALDDGPAGSDQAQPPDQLGQDLAGRDGAIVDLAVVDRAVVDRAVLDLAVADATVVDGAPLSDFSGADRAPPADALGSGDLLLCGSIGTPCCQGTCGAGACCGAGNLCVALGTSCGTNLICRSTGCTPCGQAFQGCCASSACSAGGCCVTAATGTSTFCTPSGSSPPLSPGAVCSNGGLTACGTAPLPCCPITSCGGGGCCDGNLCIAMGTQCAGSAGSCTSSSCNGCGTNACTPPCGAQSQSCCPGASHGGFSGDYCTAPNLVCRTGTTFPSPFCDPCGTPGKPCCPGNTCAAGGCCEHSTGVPLCVKNTDACPNAQGVCADGSCGNTCGKRGQPACGGGVDCTGPLVVNSGGQCVACGGLAQPCCAAANGHLCEPPYGCNSSTATGTCQLCGGTGQPCCPGSQCYPSTQLVCDLTTSTCL